MNLKILNTLKPLYFLPHDNFTEEVLIPSLKVANYFDCMIGFFKSDVLKELAPGLVEFLQNPHNQMRLIISPYLTAEDQEALKRGIVKPKEILEKRLIELIGHANINESALVKHTLDCISWMVASGQLEIKVAVVSNALFHPKIWIFNDGENKIVAHGSVNMTESGISRNYEHISVELSWADKSQYEKVNRFVEEFTRLWNGEKVETLIYSLSEAIKNRLIENYCPDELPTPNDFWEAWDKDFKSGIVKEKIGEYLKKNFNDRKIYFHIPKWLNYESGDFSHQGKAVNAWLEANGKGILEMATGSGKTITALICAYHIWNNDNRPLLLIISAPFLPLISQWAEEAKKFGLMPIIPGNQSSKKLKLSQIQKAILNLKLNISEIECIIVTHNFLCDPAFSELLGRFDGPSMLIADEVHNLGSKNFVSSQHEMFSFRLGLSATPIRQYDEAGTNKLKDFFGDIIFKFTLEEAIGKCLVPYNYFVHPVFLDMDEVEKWVKLTEKLKSLGWVFSESEENNDIEPSPEIQMILNKRRRILEQARNKIDILYKVLRNTNVNNICHTLVYASDKGREQLNQVNKVLMNKLKLRVHQITQEETSNPKLFKLLLSKFAEGKSIQVLTAMRVLDEGVDIPEISRAFILASTTVERQWIQRRGRVLRKCKRINKKNAEIHDFLVLPPFENDYSNPNNDLKKIIKSELTRVMSFANLALNAASENGPLSVVRSLINKYF